MTPRTRVTYRLRPRTTAAAAVAAAALTVATAPVLAFPASAAPGDATLTASSPIVTTPDGGTATVTIRLEIEGGGALTEPVTGQWATGAGSATAGDDYQPAGGTFTFAAGTVSGATQELTVPTTTSAGGETAETISIDLATDDAGVGTRPTVVIDAHDLPYLDAALPVDQRVEDLLSRMSLAAKVGQMTQAERANVDDSPAQIADLMLGSLLSGGGSAPEENTPEAWADMVDGYQLWTRLTPLQIPLIYGVDSVHGHSNVVGATVFPHNIGLGATRNPALVQETAHVTAEETRATGIPWTFAPCLCVARDTRWGRTYESYGEDPSLVIEMETSITGFQGEDISALDDPDRVLATAKHIGGDGDTEYGSGDDLGSGPSTYPIDQGITVTSREALERIDHAPFIPAVQQYHVGSVMPSYSSIDYTEDGLGNPIKAHADASILQEFLKDEVGFDGFVISDYHGIDQIPGERASDVRTWVNAGGDMAMEPDDFAAFELTLIDEVEAGRVSQDRIDDAVRRILTKKFQLGLFEQPFADRTNLDQIGSAEHRAVARQAAAESQVLLKNENDVLPLADDAPLYVAGRNADDLGNQMGGWTITWQGQSGRHTEGTTILEGIQEVAPAAEVTFSADASAPIDPASTGVVVVGETPYSEGFGDVGGPLWAYDPVDEGMPREPKTMELKEQDRQVIERVCAAVAECVVLVVSGRPLVLSDQLGDIDALVASWLPGSEGAGVADVLFGRTPFTGQLSQSWPRTVEQGELNVGDSSYDPLYPFGWGLTAQATSSPLSEAQTRELVETLTGAHPERLTGPLAALQHGRGLDADDPRVRELVGALRQVVQALVADPVTGVPARAADRIARSDVALLQGDVAGAVRLLIEALR
ncbi:glycoside hydrolase family 3 N-terminal domain-containing protein [Blastococcus xanthinilyticus]|uniref:beta-glucosidase n=1 Tax=Blastococcus xanthinilyticus TaxID=1564164 RepID=A0A5S5CYK0_9ACTN|nr:glycoside hydrolase family 3 N-terminal domain-containing protein [Blastococcus xanthinilyticus]TYP88857.1 beta-glucosidase [Blastococcus xanthinilyticus]